MLIEKPPLRLPVFSWRPLLHPGKRERFVNTMLPNLTWAEGSQHVGMFPCVDV